MFLRVHTAFKRSFSTTAAAPIKELIYAKRCENGQGSSFAFEAAGQDKVDVSYSTFWNDFTHYSYYADPSAKFPVIQAPIAYNQFGNSSEDDLFADKEKFIDVSSNASNSPLTYTETPIRDNKREHFSYKDGTIPGQFCAHIP